MHRSESSNRTRNGTALSTVFAAVVVIGAAVGLRVVMNPTAGGGASIDPTPPPSDRATTPLVGSDGDIQVSIELDRAVVRSGGAVTMTITITNTGSKQARYALGPCGSVSTMVARLPDLPDAAGASWSGLQARAKAFLLIVGAPPAPAEIWVDADPTTCSRAGDAVRALSAGKRDVSTVTWTPSYVPGVPVPEGEVFFRVTVRHGPAPTAAIASSTDGFRAIEVEGTIVVEKGTPGPISAAEAADTVLGDSRFAEWLKATSPDDWRVGHVFLVYIDTQQQGIVPPGPSWEVDFFRGDGPGQEWAIGFVDPSSGALRSLTLCDASCVN